MMRPTPRGWEEHLTEPHRVLSSVESYLGGTKLADVPLVAGSITYDATARQRRRVQLTVPIIGPDGFDWVPRDPATHPLGHMGQRLHIKTGTEMTLLDQGWYLIDSWSTSRAEGIVTVNAVDVIQILDDALMAWDFFTAWGGGVHWIESPTFRQAIDDLLKLGDWQQTTQTYLPPEYRLMPWSSEGVNLDQIVLAEFVYSRSRADTIDTLLSSIGARMLTRDDGQLWAVPAFVPSQTPVVTLRDSAGGSVSERDIGGSRGRLFNTVLVRGKNPPTVDPFKNDPWSARWADGGGMKLFGPFGVVPVIADADTLDSNDKTAAAAASLFDLSAMFAHAEQVTVIPNPAIELEDTATVTTKFGGTFTGTVMGIVCPLTASDGPMTVTVSTDVVPSRSRSQGER